MTKLSSINPIRKELEHNTRNNTNEGTKYACNMALPYTVISGVAIRDFDDIAAVNGTNSATLDGMQYTGDGFAHVSRSVLSRTEKTPSHGDELASVVNGADVVFYRVRFKDNGKGFLLGSGDSITEDLIKGQRVLFYECIFDSCSRRNPFIQVGQGYMSRCLIRNWGKNFFDKSFGARAGAYGQLLIVDTVFEQEGFMTCIKRWHNFKDVFGQYLWPLFGVPGWMRGAYADRHGSVRCHHCYKNHKWIYLENHTSPMSNDDAEALVAHLEANVPA